MGVVFHWHLCRMVSTHPVPISPDSLEARLTRQEYRRPTHCLSNLYRAPLQLVRRKPGSALAIRIHRLGARLLPWRTPHRHRLDTIHQSTWWTTSTRVSPAGNNNPRGDWPWWASHLWVMRCASNALDWPGCWVRHAGVWSGGHL